MTACPTHHPADRRAIVVKGAVVALFVGASSRWVVEVGMSDPFLPRILVRLVGFQHLVIQWHSNAVDGLRDTPQNEDQVARWALGALKGRPVKALKTRRQEAQR